ncbi:MAG: translation initiation factor IF-3 [Bacteroidetes bacterium]|nr:MAG: translation initiation factor IF-3 [Bacteroidota bacterium]
MAVPFYRPRPSGGSRPFQRNFNRFQKREDLHNINGRIRHPQVRVVGEGFEPVVVAIEVALRMAQDAGLDLVEISATATPPVCKIIEYKKFLYEHKKKEKEKRANTTKVVVKEIRFTPHTDEHDFTFKKNHAQRFLEEGSKVRAYVFFKGRTIMFKDQGRSLLMRFAQELEEVGKIEQMPIQDGKKMIILLGPGKKK